MRNERRKQVLTLSILAVSVLAISVGFAAFSSVLRINTTAQVNPDVSSFGVKFSTANNTVITGTVSPTLYPSTETTNLGKTVAASNITVDGTTNLTGLNATFISPGDYVTYKVYAVNSGSYDAYLNNINFLGSKNCTAGEGATDSLVQQACNGISVSVSVAGTSYSSTTPITGHSLAKTKGEEIIVTLKYDSSASRADGPFSVSFGNVSLVYSTINDSTFKPKVCKLTDNDSSGGATKSDEVTCDSGEISESFYVLENESGKVNMLAAYNLTLSPTSPVQDKTGAKNPIKFANNIDYWLGSSRNLILDTNYKNEGRSYPYVYGNYPENNIYPYVEAYRDVLEGMGVNVIDAKLLSYEQIVGLGCPDSLYVNCPAAPSWLFESFSWLGSVQPEYQMIIAIGPADDTGNYLNLVAQYDGVFSGIRPVITISASDLG